MPVDKIRYFPPLGCGITQKGGGEYFEDYPTFVYKADVGGFQEKKSVYIATWVKTAFVTQCLCLGDFEEVNSFAYYRIMTGLLFQYIFVLQ